MISPVFKSWPTNWRKERIGYKPNTFRKVDESDPRFNYLRMGCTHVTIENSRNGERFTREITDYTEWDGYAIISWAHHAGTGKEDANDR